MRFEQKKILMISSNSSLGGGSKHMFILGKNLNYKFKIYYAIPKNSNFQHFLNSKNHIPITERKITLNDIINLNNFIRLNSIDIIHAHGKGAVVLARFLKLFNRVPLIYTFHGIHLKCHSKVKRIAYIFYEFIFGRLDTYKIFVSRSEKEYALLSKIYSGIKYSIINNGVQNMPIKNFQRISDLSTNRFHSREINVISVCRFVEQKNLKELIMIAELSPKLNFSIIGDGPLWKEVKDIISKRKIKNINLLGKKENVFKYLYKSDIYLSTSLYEGLPISILEAMSIGLPIVASNVVGNCDTIEHSKSGFLYPLKDIQMASNYLESLANSIDLITKIGNFAFKRQRKLFSKNLMISNHIDLYNEIIKKL